MGGRVVATARMDIPRPTWILVTTTAPATLMPMIGGGLLMEALQQRAIAARDVLSGLAIPYRKEVNSDDIR
jgi:hypothetical protein